MENTKQVITDLSTSKIFKDIYQDDYSINIDRFKKLNKRFTSIFNQSPSYYFSTPGRVELSGNHTDHNHGKVIAGSINLDSIASVNPSNDNFITLYSNGYETGFVIDTEDLDVIEEEKGTTASLIRGVCSGIKKNGFKIGGFNACITSDVLVGSGLSSSASIEVLIGTIINKLFNESQIPFEKIALVGQYAENNYFGKPCGLMDQVACAAGGIVSIDFADSQNPVIEKLDIDFDATGYRLVIVDTGGNHADLTGDYAAIPNEMKEVAAAFGNSFLRESAESEFYNKLSVLRTNVSDRAILRAIHFFEENKRVDKQVAALKKNNFNEFMEYVNESGSSSFKYLQNIFTPQEVDEQGVSLALALSELFINKIGKGACRINGGGFAGTIEVFIPVENIEEFNNYISAVFGAESVKILSIRQQGTVCLNE